MVARFLTRSGQFLPIISPPCRTLTAIQRMSFKQTMSSFRLFVITNARLAFLLYKLSNDLTVSGRIQFPEYMHRMFWAFKYCTI